ncbi:hypothetical protein AB0J35_28960 [Nonomuraea angiospora]|uniref:hypothetical protein n=1 Tax=Nonomuraea angiospora TaxID=46172 RepID=UPI003425E348
MTVQGVEELDVGAGPQSGDLPDTGYGFFAQRRRPGHATARGSGPGRILVGRRVCSSSGCVRHAHHANAGETSAVRGRPAPVHGRAAWPRVGDAAIAIAAAVAKT